MVSNALNQINTKANPQRVKARNDQVQNNEGGYVFTVDNKSRLERFLIIGTDGGTYYASERKITAANVDFIKSLIALDERLVLDTLVDISVSGRAYKNSPAIFTLALLFVEGKDKAAARAAVQKVCRTSTHLFEFAQYIENLGGWGRAKRSAVADWYANKEVDQLAYQLVKYRQRDGWTHRDLLRLSHPTGLDENLVNFALGKETNDSVKILEGFKYAQRSDSVKNTVKILNAYPNLPWEALRTEHLTDAEVWKRLFYNDQLNGQALLRNVTRLAKMQAFNDLTFAADYAKRLADPNMIAKTRLHPINYLNTLMVHTEGQTGRADRYGYSGDRSKTWNATPVIVDALNKGFHESFKTVTPANKRTMLGVDVSGSMGWTQALGIDLMASQVAAAVAMTIARTEPYYFIGGFSNHFVDLGISPESSLNDTLRKVQKQTFGGTDASIPMDYALKNGIEIDTFVVITDNETYAGRKHPFQALKEYRQKTGINAKLAVLAVSSTGFTIADPTDRGMMDFVGFDSNAPKVLADFSAGRL